MGLWATGASAVGLAVWLTPGVSSPASGVDEEKAIIAYVFPRDRVLDPAEIAAEKLTHVNYAFALVQAGKMVEGSPRDGENLAALAAVRRQHPQLRILVSVGGWTGSGGFSDMALTAEGRRRFVESVAEFLRRHDLDGLDVDWEYPGLPGNGNTHRPEDKADFTALMADLRAGLDTEGAAHGRRYLLTFAAGAFPDFLAQTEMAKVQSSVDFVNLMTYDFREAGADPEAGHHANLYTHPADPKQLSADRAVRDFLAAGAPPGKLVLGVPFYGRAWGDVQKKGRGLYRPAKPLAERIDTSYAGLLALEGQKGWTRAWDGVSQAPFLWNASRRIFISYEDPRSLRLKSRYVRDRHLGGVMFWEYFADRTGTLLGALCEGLGRCKVGN
jgi:chitinase